MRAAIQPKSELTKGDLLLIRQVYEAYVRFGIPFLPARKWWKRAGSLAKRGLLKPCECKIFPPQDGLDGYLPTADGINAHNASIAKARELQP